MAYISFERHDPFVDETCFEALQQSVGDTVKALRQGQGFTQEDMAFGSGVSVRHYQQLESGRGNPTLVTLARLATKLGIRASDLLKKSEEKIQPR